MATKDPIVPGAYGLQPEQNPLAKKTHGFLHCFNVMGAGLVKMVISFYSKGSMPRGCF